MTLFTFPALGTQGNRFQTIEALQAEVRRAIAAAFAEIGEDIRLVGEWAASSGAFPTSPTPIAGSTWIVTDAGTVDGIAFIAGDKLSALGGGGATYAGNWLRIPRADLPEPLPQASGGTGATTLGVATVTPTGAPADTLANHLAYLSGGGMVFNVLNYILLEDPTQRAAIETYNYDAQNETAVLAGFRAAADAMLAYLQASPTNKAATLHIPAGGYSLRGTPFSDAFLEAFWLTTGIDQLDRCTISGDPLNAAATVLKVSPNWPGATRTYAFGPWAGGRGPAALLPIFKSLDRGPSISLSNIRLRGNRNFKDPIGILKINDLDTRNLNVSVENFMNWGRVIMGCFNSEWYGTLIVNCGLGLQEGGKYTANYMAGGYPRWVRVNATRDSATQVTLQAFAAEARGGFAVNDPVPIFQTGHVGRRVFVELIEAGTVATELTVDSVSGAATANGFTGYTTAVASPSDAAAVITRSNASSLLTFRGIRGTWAAAGDTITLSDKAFFGTAADAIGRLIALPKAGSVGSRSLIGDFKPDVLATRIKSLSGGSDTEGYDTIEVEHAAINAGADFPLVFGAGDGFMAEETLALSSVVTPVNDVGFLNERVEYAAGFGTDPYASAPCFVHSALSGAVGFTNTKWHALFMAGQAPFLGIIDTVTDYEHIGCVWTHACEQEFGQVWFMGGRTMADFATMSVGSFRMTSGRTIINVDPSAAWGTSRSEDKWYITLSDRISVNSAARVNMRGTGGDATPDRIDLFGFTGLDVADTLGVVRYRPTEPTLLDATCDLNTITGNGLFVWGASTPANAFGTAFDVMLSFSTSATLGGPPIFQYGVDRTKALPFVRTFTDGALTPWRSLHTSSRQLANRVTSVVTTDYTPNLVVTSSSLLKLQFSGAITINAPVNSEPGEMLHLELECTSGSGHIVTFNAAYRLASATTTSGAAGSRRQYTFRRDGGVWLLVADSGAWV